MTPLRSRRVGATLLLLGVWLFGIVFMGFVAITNFTAVDRLLGGPSHAGFEEIVAGVSAPTAREFLRYFASELNRHAFQTWGAAQVLIGALALWAVWGASSRWPRYGVLVMLALTVLGALWITPGIVSIGRTLDFIPREPPPPALGLFRLLHAAYTIGDAVKLLIGGFTAWGLIRML